MPAHFCRAESRSTRAGPERSLPISLLDASFQPGIQFGRAPEISDVPSETNVRNSLLLSKPGRSCACSNPASWHLQTFRELQRVQHFNAALGAETVLARHLKDSCRFCCHKIFNLRVSCDSVI